MGDIKKERDDLKAKYEKVGNDYETLRRTQTSKEEDAKKRHSRLEEKIRELETEKLRLTSGSSSMVKILFFEITKFFPETFLEILGTKIKDNLVKK